MCKKETSQSKIFTRMTYLRCAFALVLMAMVSLYATPTNGVPISICPARAHLCFQPPCRYGYMNDKNGCPTCQCNTRPGVPICPARAHVCFQPPCRYGYMKDSNGCLTCQCNTRPI